MRSFRSGGKVGALIPLNLMLADDHSGMHRLAAVRTMFGAPLARNQARDLCRLMVGQAKAVAQLLETTAFVRGDDAVRQNLVDRGFEFAATLVQLLGKARGEQAGW